MKRATRLKVKGTYYYAGPPLYTMGELKIGATVQLAHQPDNPYDKNAVAVYLEDELRSMLGHLSKEVAPKYSELLAAERVVSAQISDFGYKNNVLNIFIKVVYTTGLEEERLNHDSLFIQSLEGLPRKAGVYAIINEDTGRSYIGSSRDIRLRADNHYRQLSRGTHPNSILQKDFDNLGYNCFSFDVVDLAPASGDLEEMEEEEIHKLLLSNCSLYNLTEDGKGRFHGQEFANSNEAEVPKASVSEKRQARLKEDEHVKKEMAIRAEYQSQLDSLLPTENYWAYFFGCVIALGLAIESFLPRLGGWDSIFIAAFVSFFLADLLKDFFRKRAEDSFGYQNLIRERDERIRKLDYE